MLSTVRSVKNQLNPRGKRTADITINRRVTFPWRLTWGDARICLLLRFWWGGLTDKTLYQIDVYDEKTKK